MQQQIVPNLWFDTKAEDAAEFYTSTFPNSRITRITRYPASSERAGQVLTAEFELNGNPVLALNGGPQFKFDEAVSLQIECDDQEEIDRYWEALSADGGEEGMCGWVTDKFGLCWQVTPAGMVEYFEDGDAERTERVWAAMQEMRKLDIAALEAAAAGAS